MVERTLGDLCSREREMFYHLELDMPDGWEETFDFAHKDKDSYYVLRGRQEYLMEYGFETLPQLKEILDKLWENDSCVKNIEKTVLVAAIKNKPKQETRESRERDTDGCMPEFVYNF